MSVIRVLITRAPIFFETKLLFNDFEERMQILQKHIKDLNLLDKGILMLYLERKSHEEIAEIIGISKSNVGTKLSRIKDKLRLQVSNNYR